MTGPAFMSYLAAKIGERIPAFVSGDDPVVEFYDGIVRIHDQRGESLSLPRAHPRQLCALAFMLEEVASEMERRRFER